MGLSIFLVGPDYDHECQCSCGHVHTIREKSTVFSGSVTHNLTSMARAADIYSVLWLCDFKKARELIEPLTVGLDLLTSDPKRFRQYDPPNNWGNYESLVTFVRKLVAACSEYPDCEIICEP